MKDKLQQHTYINAKLHLPLPKQWHAFVLGCVLLAITFTTACSAPSRDQKPAASEVPTVMPNQMLRVFCPDEIRKGLSEIVTQQIQIPDSPDCSVHLRVKLDKIDYGQSDKITVYTMLEIQGNCTWDIQETSPMRDFYPIVITNEKGENAPLTEKGQMAKRWAESLENDSRGFISLSQQKSSCIGLPVDEWFDLSGTGTYTLTLVRRNFGAKPDLVPGNTVIFRRLP